MQKSTLCNINMTADLLSFRTFNVRRLTSLTLSFISGTHVESQVKSAGGPTGSQKLALVGAKRHTAPGLQTCSAQPMPTLSGGWASICASSRRRGETVRVSWTCERVDLVRILLVKLTDWLTIQVVRERLMFARRMLAPYFCRKLCIDGSPAGKF